MWVVYSEIPPEHWVSLLRLLKQNTLDWVVETKLVFPQFWRQEVCDQGDGVVSFGSPMPMFSLWPYVVEGSSACSSFWRC